MRRSEAVWIRGALSKIGNEALDPVLELGSATTHFRTVTHPHVESEIHAPLRTRRVTIVTSDLKSGDGVDISGDIYQTDTQIRIKAIHPKTVLCCNMFEHVDDRYKFASICDEVLSPGGYLLITVPHSYPYHLDPIDTMFRPSVDEIAKLFPYYELVEGRMIIDTNYSQDLLREYGWSAIPFVVAKLLGRLILPIHGFEYWKSHTHYLLWLFRAYKIAGVLLRKPSR